MLVLRVWDMDYLSRLVGSAAASPTKQPAADSQQRSIRFNKVHDQLQQIWRKNNSSKQPVPASPVLACLGNIHKILHDELQSPAPHLCARHVSIFRTYATIVQVALTYYDEGVLHKVLDIFGILIESEEVEFLKEKAFADAIIGFIANVSTTGPRLVSVGIEGRIVEVLFRVASRIKLQPSLLPTWFRPNAEQSKNNMDGVVSKNVATVDKDIFPLFYLTLDYVHHNGRVGDFARTALLYVIETTVHSEPLERWIVESDLATLMASGLGALYSQLSRKLVISYPTDPIPAVISFSETVPPSVPRDVVETSSAEFQAHLTTFLSYLAFWQDMLEHCRSDDVRNSLLDHFKLLFLQQLLYPSLVESSDSDGGSSVAVLTYLRCIIESIDHIDLLDITLRYLLALPERSEGVLKPVRPTTLARRRKSSMLMTNLAQGQEKPTPDLFTLVDLVLTSLRSRDQRTVSATLRLVSVILSNQHQYAVMSILKTQPAREEDRTRTLDLHQRSVDALLTMAEDLVEHDELAEAYETHLQDARTLLETHCCSAQLIALPNFKVDDVNTARRNGVSPAGVLPHSIRTEDGLLQSLTFLLEEFLTNDLSTNLSLTQTFSALASCGNTSLNKWILHDSISPSASNEDETQSGNSPSRGDFDNRPQHTHLSNGVSESGVPQHISLLDTLRDLVQKVEQLHSEIRDLDVYLAEQRHVLKVGEGIDQALANDLARVPMIEDRRAGDTGQNSVPQARGVGHIGLISERLVSEAHSSNGSRSTSPRGRQPLDPSPLIFVDRLNHLRLSPSTSPSKPASRAFSPSPLRTDMLAPRPPKAVPKDQGPTGVPQQRVKIKNKMLSLDPDIKYLGESETSSIQSDSVPETSNVHTTVEVPLSQLLTNIIILQEFILELAAILEVRATMFGEVLFG